MIILKQNRSAASYTDYHGFTLQPGYWFGHDDETGEYVASSGWEVNHDLALYRRNQVTGEWEMSWVDQDETEIVASGFAVPDLAAKKTFKQWLKEDYGVEPEDYDEHYCGTFADEVESDYEDYINDGLPLFARTAANMELAAKDEGTGLENAGVVGTDKVFTYRDGFRRSITPYLEKISHGNLAAAGSAFQALNTDRGMIDADIRSKKTENLHSVSEKADTLLLNCYQLLRGNGIAAPNARKIVEVYLNDPDFFEHSRKMASDETNKKEFESFKNGYAEFNGEVYPSVITEAINVLSMGVNAEQIKASKQIEKAAALEEKAYKKEYMESIMQVYSLGRDCGLSKEALMSVFSVDPEHSGIRDMDTFFNGLESVYSSRHKKAEQRAIAENAIALNEQFMRELEALKEECRENGIEENTLAYELRMEHLYEKYQMDEIHTGKTAENRETDEPERE